MENDELHPVYNSDIPLEYLNKISKTPLLSIEQEQELAKRMAQGDQEARAQLIEANLRLVVAIGKLYLNRGLQFSDIIEEGKLGLLRAADKFSIERGFKFSTYAYWWIKQSIEIAIVNHTKDGNFPSVHIFNGGVDSNDVSADELSSLATLMSKAAGEFASYCLVEISWGKQISEADLDVMHNVHLETLCLYFHIIDRDSIFANHSITKQTFMNNLIAEVFLLYKDRFEKLQKSNNMAEFIDLCNERQSDYRKIIPDDGNIKGTLFWEYGKKISRIMLRPSDKMIITEAYANAISSINAMHLERFFDKL